VAASHRAAPLRRRRGGALQRERRARLHRPEPGIGFLKYIETAQFAQAGDDVHQTFTSYHLAGGAEFSVTRHVGVIGEALYRWVPNALGTSGVSKAFGETDLGGLVIRVRGTYTF
jgi:hypothetical protein